MYIILYVFVTCIYIYAHALSSNFAPPFIPIYMQYIRIASISCPIFVIHGTRDEIVPFWNGEELFLAAPIQWRACPYWVEKAGHNDVELVQK